MELLKKYKNFILEFGIIFWIFAKINGMQELGTNILWLAINLVAPMKLFNMQRRLELGSFLFYPEYL